jgi:hypothetical protein
MPIAHVLAIAPRIAILAAHLSFIVDHLVTLFHIQAYFAVSSSTSIIDTIGCSSSGKRGEPFKTTVAGATKSA